jgi:transposase
MRRKRNRKKKPRPDIREIGLDELQAILERAKSEPLDDDEYGKLKAAVETLAFVTSELEKKRVSVTRLKKLLFGASTEKTSQVFKDAPRGDGPCADGESADRGAAGEGEGEKNKDKKRKGHGRNGAADYTGAEKIRIAHESLQSGACCPECDKGKVYLQKEPAVIVRIRGMAPLGATVYERERFRCNLCGKVFTAASPEGVGEDKYDETAAAMIALLKYGAGLPFNRIEKLQKGLGIPMPASVQWELVAGAAEKTTPAYEEIVRQGAQGTVVHNDDTTMKILEIERQAKRDAMEGKDAGERTGVFTTGIVSVGSGHRIALFFTGRKHAGENLESVLARRAEQLGPPIQMCDLLSRNTSGDFETIVAGCISHSRRRYVDVAENFPDEVRHVLEELKKVYKNDATARKEEMTPEQRLAFHQSTSGLVMEKLEEWLTQQIEEKKVEPNSSLGDAIQFMQNHWDKLTLFLRVPGAPLDNNICERALKKAILHRKNAYFYKTENGARVGDMFMTFIHTSELNEVDAFDYLVALQRHADEVQKAPAEWMPWNYKEALQRLDSGPDPPR